MNINNNLNQYVTMLATKTQLQNKENTSVATNPKTDLKMSKSATYDAIGKIKSIPNLEQYEALIQRFLSGESELESSSKPLTDDQIALKGLMREYRKTDTRTFSQIQTDMQLTSNNFFKYWMSSGNTVPMPGRVLSADGSFHIFNSKTEKDEFMKKNTMSFLENVMSVINARKNNGSTDKTNNLDLKV